MQGKIIYQTVLNGQQLVIRYAKIEDAPILMDYINTISLEQTFIRFQGEQLTLQQETDYLTAFLKQTDLGRAVKLMAFIGDTLVGVSDTEMKDRVEKHIGIFGITLANNYRHHGIGTILMDQVLKEAAKNLKNLKIIELSVFANNPIAYNLYKKMGFIEFGNLPNGILHRGQFVDHIYMYKEVKNV